ncbi:MAG: S-methyl-5'-thioadenosine phosphorylase [Sphingomonadaceae bacterium]|nr:S-methyl-5'-thioadenosine phosphorylase [Sphingomonadaceae bacterium]
MTSPWHIGVIGGSGIYQSVELDDAQEIPVESGFGDPSGPVTTGWLGGVRFTFIARHGEQHKFPPSQVNYRANIDVLKRCGVTDVLALSAIGSLKEDYAPGHFVAVDQMIDRTAGRERSFFGEGCVAHVSLADPVCARLSALAGDAAEAAGATVHRSGTYVAIEGPQFSTRAESHMYRAWGADVIGMTAMPEARLAREAELPYALLAMVTDYDCWRSTEEEANVEAIVAVMRNNAQLARSALVKLAELLPPERLASPIDTALAGAFASNVVQPDPALRARLSAVAGRVWQ